MKVIDWINEVLVEGQKWFLDFKENNKRKKIIILDMKVRFNATTLWFRFQNQHIFGLEGKDSGEKIILKKIKKKTLS